MPNALTPRKTERIGVVPGERGRVEPPLPYERVIVPVADTIDPLVAGIAAQLAERIGVTSEVLAVVSAGLESLDAMQLRTEIDELGRPMGLHLVTDTGDVPGAILAAATERRGLLCLGTRGASALGEALFGSVAAEAIRRSHREVVVVGPHCEPDVQGDTLVIAIDGSEGARIIVPTAVDLAGLLDLRPQLIQVMASGATSPSERRAELARITAVARLAPGGRASDEELLVHGSRVDQTLIAMSAQRDVAMIAMATHGLGRFERLVGGSVTLDVVRRAHCPVLIGRRRG